MLGELYVPSGMALETARAVLEVDNPHAVNVALGCPNECSYCYGPLASRQGREKYHGILRFPKKEPFDLVRNQLAKGFDTDGVFASFLTDPYLPALRHETERLVNFILNQQEYLDKDIPMATLSKIGVSDYSWNRNGMTIVSPYNDFTAKYEPGVSSPNERIRILEEECYNEGHYSWVSYEPCPVQDIYPYDTKDILDFWESLNFVDFMVFGKWNYDKRARTERARQEYGELVALFEDFCTDHGIRYHVKSGTLEFIRPVEGSP